MNTRLLRLSAVLLTLATSGFTQTLTVLRDQGPRDQRLNLAIVGEGYTAAEQDTFQTHAAQTLTKLLEHEALAPFKDYLNAFALATVSAESGADIPAESVQRATYLNATFGSAGTDRLLTVDSAKTGALLLQFVPDWDIAIVLVNSPRYGGSGGLYAVASMHALSFEVLIHELGHSFAHLADEYVDEATAARFPLPVDAKNATQHTQRELIPWRRFILPTTPLPSPAVATMLPGLYEGAYYRAHGVYRPLHDSAMRTLGAPFGPVSLRAFADRVMALNLLGATQRPTAAAQPVVRRYQDGETVTLAVTVEGTGPFTYQWSANHVFLAENTNGPKLEVRTPGAIDGFYHVEVRNAAGAVELFAGEIYRAGTDVHPVITTPPTSAQVRVGEAHTLSVQSVRGWIYQWFKDGVAIAGATDARLTVTGFSAQHAGSYTVRVENSFGSTSSTPASLQVKEEPAPGYPINLSVRGVAGSGDATLIGGFVLEGAGEKSILIRAAGPALEPHGVPQFLPNPRVTLFRGDEPIASNDDWSSDLAATFDSVGAFAWPAGSRDAALLVTLAAGQYTVQVGNGDASGREALIEIYDVTQTPSPVLKNVSCRVWESTSVQQPLILGVTLRDDARVLIRNAGPVLKDYDVAHAASDTVLRVLQGNQQIADNDDWDDPRLPALFAAVGAFGFPAGSKDAALHLAQPPRQLTIHAHAKGEAGVGLVELYLVR